MTSDVEKRLASLQAWVVAGLAFMLVAAFASVIGVALVVQRSQNESNEALACYVLPQMERAQDTLPTLSYYKEHPDELEDQLAVIRRQREVALETWGSCDSVDS